MEFEMDFYKFKSIKIKWSYFYFIMIKSVIAIWFGKFDNDKKMFDLKIFDFKIFIKSHYEVIKSEYHSHILIFYVDLPFFSFSHIIPRSYYLNPKNLLRFIVVNCII